MTLATSPGLKAGFTRIGYACPVERREVTLVAEDFRSTNAFLMIEQKGPAARIVVSVNCKECGQAHEIVLPGDIT